MATVRGTKDLVRGRRLEGPGPVNVGPGERALSLVSGGALVIYGLLRRRARGLLAGLIGGGLLYRGLTGRSAINRALRRDTTQAPQRVRVDRAVTINRPPEDLYHFFRNFGNLPRFMDHLREVRVLDERGLRSHWVARGPAGIDLRWDAEIINEEPGRLIVWRSLPGADVEHEGSVRFTALPGDRGTVVRVALRYAPPAGRIGDALARMLGEDPGSELEEDLRRFKQLMETGEVPQAPPSRNGHRRQAPAEGGTP